MEKAIKRAIRKSGINVEAVKTYTIILLISYIIGKAIIVVPLGVGVKAFFIIAGMILSVIDFDYKLTAFSAFLIGFMIAA